MNLESEEQGIGAAGVFSSVGALPGRGVGALRSPTPRPLHPLNMDEVKVVPPQERIEKKLRMNDENRIAKDKLRWKSLKIRTRDLRVLGLILQQKFLTLDQIHRSCFEKVSLQMPRMRLRKLMHFGMIRTRRVYTESRQVYLLDKGGYEYLDASSLSMDLGYMPEIDLRVFEHDKAVTDLRLALEAAGIVAWKSERELRKERPGARVPDAVFVFDGMSIALEFENADKGAERYRSIFLDHLDKPAADHVLYVLRSEEKLKVLPLLLAGLQERRLGLDMGRISFGLEAEVLALRLDARAVNLKYGELKIAEIPAKARRDA